MVDGLDSIWKTSPVLINTCNLPRRQPRSSFTIICLVEALRARKQGTRNGDLALFSTIGSRLPRSRVWSRPICPPFALEFQRLGRDLRTDANQAQTHHRSLISSCPLQRSPFGSRAEIHRLTGTPRFNLLLHSVGSQKPQGKTSIRTVSPSWGRGERRRRPHMPTIPVMSRSW